jgi:hypothetical protein
LSNTFLHPGQDVEKAGEKGLRAVPGGGESLEEWFHSYFNPVARVKRPKRGFDDDGRPPATCGPAPSPEKPTPCAVL